MTTYDATEDIAANRRGYLSPAQGALVGAAAHAPMLAMGIVVAALNIVAGVIWLGIDRGGPATVIAILSSAGILALAAWAALAYVKRARQKASALPIEVLDGTISWSGSEWVARSVAAPHRRLVTYALPPGPYRFYVFQEQIVGAESLLGKGSFALPQVVGPVSWSALYMSFTARVTPLPIGDRPTLVAALGQAFGFSSADLEANRHGMLGPSQGSGPVVSLDGIAQLRWVLRSKLRPADTSIVVGGVEFPISYAASAVFVSGLAYRIYRRANDGRMVSLEPL